MPGVPLRFSAKEAVPRKGEPVSVSLPWPKGAAKGERDFVLLKAGQPQPFQAVKVLDRWPDGSIRWARFEFTVDWDGKSSESVYRIELHRAKGSIEPVTMQECLAPTSVWLLTKTVSLPNEPWNFVKEPSLHFTRAGLTVNCHAQPLTLTSARLTIRIINPNASDHPGGNWDLGNAGSEYIHSFGFHVHPRETESGIHISLERDMPFHSHAAIALWQESSGGENWQSLNHLDRHRNIAVASRGYSNGPLTGPRATPIAVLQTTSTVYSLAAGYFWENFPQGLTASTQGLSMHLLPFLGEERYHELQGGESKTWSFVFQWGKETITEEPLVWGRSPIMVTVPPEWYESTNAIPYLTSKPTDRNTTYLSLVNQAIEGSDTFIKKREMIDEYGWRHFGDIWGDHEAVYYPNPPMISHYNNQYDCVAAFLIQYLRSSDTRWLEQGLECAWHTCDIDIYHTTKDKSAYNGGLFWHTYHYAPADTGTHRSYPKSLRNAQHFDDGKSLDTLGKTGQALKKNYAVGGGPSAAHNYNAGLMLAYFLTGEEYFKQSAVGLADFVLNMDDGNKTIFRWLSRADTGLSIQSSDGYLGPGRASANSLIAVLTGHRLTGDHKYLEKASQIVRRVVHPNQNLSSLDLLNAELRWFYVMFLQALGHYLDYKIEIDQLDDDYHYARLSLLHYARYMEQHERPILSEPEKLQYPTETWAAQDMRKVEVFQYAAKHTEGEEKKRFLEKAEWFFRYVETTLDHFPPTDRGIATKSLCRPVILMMKYGWTRAWWQRNPDHSAPPPANAKPASDYGTWTMYVPQKTIAIRRAKRLVKLGILVGTLLMLALIVYFLMA